jgi:hypothetical protein
LSGYYDRILHVWTLVNLFWGGGGGYEGQ